MRHIIKYISKKRKKMEINSEGNLLSKDLKNTSDTMKLYFLEKTVDESVELINYGLNFLGKIEFANAFLIFSLSFLNLSRGFELLMKCMICYREYNDLGRFPTKKNMRKDYGHDINKLREKIGINYQGLFQKKASNTRIVSQLQEDYNFINENEEIIRILEIISKYATVDRYYNLDYVVLDSPPKDVSAQSEMQKMILEFLEKDKQLRSTFMNNRENSLSDDKIWQEIIEKYIKPDLIKFKRALGRQFVYGILGEKAKKCRSICSYKFTS